MRKRGMESEMVAYLLIALAVLIVVVGAIILFRDKGVSAIDYIKNMFITGGR
jgi:hypothetical protein